MRPVSNPAVGLSSDLQRPPHDENWMPGRRTGPSPYTTVRSSFRSSHSIAVRRWRFWRFRDTRAALRENIYRRVFAKEDSTGKTKTYDTLRDPEQRLRRTHNVHNITHTNAENHIALPVVRWRIIGFSVDHGNWTNKNGLVPYTRRVTRPVRSDACQEEHYREKWTTGRKKVLPDDKKHLIRTGNPLG